MAELKNLMNDETTLLDFMAANGFAVYHKSNIFLRDIEYGIRAYYRAEQDIDVGTRTMDRLAAEFVRIFEQKGVLQPLRERIWILNNERYLKEKPVEEQQEAAASEVNET